MGPVARMYNLCCLHTMVTVTRYSASAGSIEPVFSAASPNSLIIVAIKAGPQLVKFVQISRSVSGTSTAVRMALNIVSKRFFSSLETLFPHEIRETPAFCSVVMLGITRTQRFLSLVHPSRLTRLTEPAMEMSRVSQFNICQAGNVYLDSLYPYLYIL